MIIRGSIAVFKLGFLPKEAQFGFQQKSDRMKVKGRKHCIFTLIIFWMYSSTALFAQAEFKAKALHLLTEAVDQGKCAGIAAGFSVQSEINWMDGAGEQVLKSGNGFKQQTLTRIASITKSMTAVAVLQLYEQGKVDLDATIQAYIDDFPQKSEGDITVRQLLQHSSGIDGYQSGRERENKVYYNNLEEAIRIFRDRDLVHQPGAAFHYTTYGYVVLGRLIERVSGMSYENYLQKNIWEPAAMTNTGVEIAGRKYENKSALYHLRSGRKLKSVKPTDLSDRVPGGGVYSTVEDLLKFGQALLEGKLLDSSTLELMWQDSGLKREGNAYGMGWYLYGENPHYGPVYGHNGAQTGASTFLMLLPEQQTTIVVLSNTSGAMQTVTDITLKLFDLAAAARDSHEK